MQFCSVIDLFFYYFSFLLYHNDSKLGTDFGTCHVNIRKNIYINTLYVNIVMLLLFAVQSENSALEINFNQRKRWVLCQKKLTERSF